MKCVFLKKLGTFSDECPFGVLIYLKPSPKGEPYFQGIRDPFKVGSFWCPRFPLKTILKGVFVFPETSKLAVLLLDFD